MILQSLYEYAQRKGDELPADGFENKEIKFLIKIREDGSFVDLIDTREGKKGKVFLVPQSVGRAGANSWQVTSLLWDHYGYVLAQPKQLSETASEKERDKAIQDAKKQNKTFINKILSLPDSVKTDKGVAAVIKFYTTNKANGIDKVKTAANWEECSKIPGCNMTFILEGESSIVIRCPAITDYVEHTQLSTTEDCDEAEDKPVEGICLVTGERNPIARIHTATPVLHGKSNAKLVGFQKSSGYDSYGKEQSFNAPVSFKAEAGYTKALNHLLKSEKNHFMLGQDTVVFWAEKQNDTYDFEGSFGGFFAQQNKDDPDANVQTVKALFNEVYSGHSAQVDSNFYVLCLSPNVARISIRFWETGPVEVFEKRIAQHFVDFEIVKAPQAPQYLSLQQILVSTALQYKFENVPPNLYGDTARAVFEGTCYPRTLQQQCLRRIRAERNVTRERAAILKAYMNREKRIHGANYKEVLVAVDRTNTNIGYLLGRLFAVLEKIQIDPKDQKEQERKLNATITDRFYGAASTNPSTVFSQLLKLSQHHLSSYAENSKGIKTIREKEIQEITDKIPASTGIPAHLNLDEQSMFAIGYYHERQSFFEKKDSDNK